MTRRDILRALGAAAVFPRALPATSIAATVTVTTTPIGAIGPAFAGLSYEKSQMANPSLRKTAMLSACSSSSAPAFCA